LAGSGWLETTDGQRWSVPDLHVVSGTDHGFDGHEDDAVHAAVAWLPEDSAGHTGADRNN
jgi:hypothetical protein